MNFIVKYFDEPMILFSATMDTREPDIKIGWVTPNTQLLPLDLVATEDGLYRWLRRRTIPKNRAYAHNLLAKQGLSINRPMEILRTSKGLSLNDCYWVCEVEDKSTFRTINLYQNPISRTLAQIALTGQGSTPQTSVVSSPEFTTHGMLPKCWRRDNGILSLWKGGTIGTPYAGIEPYSEFYSWQIGKALGFSVVPYNLAKWKNCLCSTCPIFTSLDLSFFSAGQLVPNGGLDTVFDYYKKLGPDFVKSLEDMIILDALLLNVDRHLGNFGVLVDTATNKIIAPAPLFDHGNALFHCVNQDSCQSEEDCTQYISTLRPALYDDFVSMARNVFRPEHKIALSKLENFHFKRHSRYNLPEKYLKQIERQLEKRTLRLSANHRYFL